MLLAYKRLKNWINSLGGLQKKMIFLTGGDLAAMYPECHGS